SNVTSLNAQIHPDGIYLKDSAPGSDETGTRQSPTVPTVIITTPRIPQSSGTQPAPVPGVLCILAIGCIIFITSIRKQRRE
ncbi:MAG: hypothetical protein WC406_02175, partial [Methanoregula sp.]